MSRRFGSWASAGDASSAAKALRLHELFRARCVVARQLLDPLQSFPGLGLLRCRERRIQILGFDRLEVVQFRRTLLNFGGSSGQPDRAARELGLPHVEMRRRHAFDDPLGPVGAVVRCSYRRLRRDLIGDHADRQQYADCAGKAELVADAIELAHFILPRILGSRGCAMANQSQRCRFPEISLGAVKAG
jgi:hypothetical protein